MSEGAIQLGLLKPYDEGVTILHDVIIFCIQSEILLLG